MRPRHFIADDDLTPQEQEEVLSTALRMKGDRFAFRPLDGPRTVAVLFDKHSTRTRVSFAIGIAELGGHPLVLDRDTTQMARGESVEDTARVLDRQCAAIVWRTFGQDLLERMAGLSAVPVINALSDLLHPCQMLADLLTVRERLGSPAGRTLAYLGDSNNNMAHSYLLGGVNAGMHVRICGPAAYQPDPGIVERSRELAARTGGSVTLTGDPVAAVTGADVLATDTWVSLGMENDGRDRETAFKGYQIDRDALAAAAPHAIVLHCLPAYRGKEIEAEVLDGPQSAVWDEAENRLHVQKALIAWLLAKGE